MGLMEDIENFRPTPGIPGHTSPPADGIVYCTIDRVVYRVKVNTYSGKQLRRYAWPSIPVDRELWRVVPGGDDQKILENDEVNFINSGFRFFTTPRVINGG